MDPIEIMKRPAPYASGHENAPAAAQLRAKRLCWEYNRTAPDEAERRGEILRELLGTCDPLTFIEPDFRCDYGFNIHTHGLTIVNYNCVMLDTSPIDIGAGAFIAPGVCLACSGHSVDAAQRTVGIGTSAPITLGRDVWIGANATGERRHARHSRRGHRGGRPVPRTASHHGAGQNRPGGYPVLRVGFRHDDCADRARGLSRRPPPRSAASTASTIRSSSRRTTSPTHRKTAAAAKALKSSSPKSCAPTAADALRGLCCAAADDARRGALWRPRAHGQRAEPAGRWVL